MFDATAKAEQAADKVADLKARAMSGSRAKKGQSLVDQGIGVMVAVIVIGAVSIPVVQDVINTVNLSGTAGTVLGYVPLALSVALFIAAISLVR
jgi:hypothetical protein